jgi:hypothetical protein
VDYLHRLNRDIACANEIAYAVVRDLPSNIDNPTAADLSPAAGPRKSR